MSGRERTLASLRKLSNLFLEKNTSGVLHVGAHEGGEASYYRTIGKNVIWIEANPDVFSRLEVALMGMPNQRAYCALLGDKICEVNFLVASNEGASSSVFEFGDYSVGRKTLWPGADLSMIRSIRLPMLTLDEFVRAQGVDLSAYNYWNIDIQGAELLFLSGAQKSLSSCLAINVEISTVEVYKGGALYLEVKNMLSQHGFAPVIEPHQLGIQHGDVVFVSRTLRASRYLAAILSLASRLPAASI